MKLTALYFFLLSIGVSSFPPKHTFIHSSQNWGEAQSYCRRYYTDLSPITSPEEDELFRQPNGNPFVGWIGLYRHGHGAPWMWSGAGVANYTNIKSLSWSSNRICGVFRESGWMAVGETYHYPFYCFNLILVDVKMSWEDALEHCRGHHTELTSLLSETETQLALSKMKSESISERVWIGLRFLEDQWMWMSGEPLKYKAWAHNGSSSEGDCPGRGRCGALSKSGAWEDWDCNEKLNFICY